jgi:hypothetical protein
MNKILVFLIKICYFLGSKYYKAAKINLEKKKNLKRIVSSNKMMVKDISYQVRRLKEIRNETCPSKPIYKETIVLIKNMSDLELKLVALTAMIALMEKDNE